MAAELRDALNIEAELERGQGGIFDVEVDGGVVYSKHETGRFPEPGEIVRILNKA